MSFLKKFKPALFLLAFLAAGCVSGSSTAQNAKAPAFTLKNVAGEEVRFEDVLKSNKAVLLNFWATWCPPCREEIPDLIRLQKDYGAKGFTVLGIDVGESANKVSAFSQKFGINYPLLLDRDQQVAARYGLVGIPTSFLVTSEGKIIGEYHEAKQDLFDDVKKAVA